MKWVAAVVGAVLIIAVALLGFGSIDPSSTGHVDRDPEDSTRADRSPVSDGPPVEPSPSHRSAVSSAADPTAVVAQPSVEAVEQVRIQILDRTSREGVVARLIGAPGVSNWTSLTDLSGAVWIPLTNKATFRVEADGYAPVTSSLDQAEPVASLEGTRQLVVELDALGELAVTVRDSHGEPVAGQAVLWTAFRGRDSVIDLLEPEPILTETDAEGIARARTRQPMIAATYFDSSTIGEATVVTPGSHSRELRIAEKTMEVWLATEEGVPNGQVRLQASVGSESPFTWRAAASLNGQQGLKFTAAEGPIALNVASCGLSLMSTDSAAWIIRNPYVATRTVGMERSDTTLLLDQASGIEVVAMDADARVIGDLEFAVQARLVGDQWANVSFQKLGRVGQGYALPPYPAGCVASDPNTRVYLRAPGFEMRRITASDITVVGGRKRIECELPKAGPRSIRLVHPSGRPASGRFRAICQETSLVVSASTGRSLPTRLKIDLGEGAILVQREDRADGFFAGTYTDLQTVTDADFATASEVSVVVAGGGAAIAVVDAPLQRQPLFAVHESGRTWALGDVDDEGVLAFRDLPDGAFVVGPREVAATAQQWPDWSARTPGVVYANGAVVEVQWNRTWFHTSDVAFEITPSLPSSASFEVVPCYRPAIGPVSPRDAARAYEVPEDRLLKLPTGSARPIALAVFARLPGLGRSRPVLVACQEPSSSIEVDLVEFEVHWAATGERPPIDAVEFSLDPAAMKNVDPPTLDRVPESAKSLRVARPDGQSVSRVLVPRAFGRVAYRRGDESVTRRVLESERVEGLRLGN